MSTISYILSTVLVTWCLWFKWSLRGEYIDPYKLFFNFQKKSIFGCFADIIFKYKITNIRQSVTKMILWLSKKKACYLLRKSIFKNIKHQQRKVIFVTLCIHRTSTKPSCIGFVFCFSTCYILCLQQAQWIICTK